MMLIKNRNPVQPYNNTIFDENSSSGKLLKIKEVNPPNEITKKEDNHNCVVLIALKLKVNIVIYVFCVCIIRSKKRTYNTRF